MAKIRQSNLDKSVITGNVEVTTVADDDQILVYDANADNIKRIKRSNFIIQGPTVASISPTVVDPDGSTTASITITGAKFEAGSSVVFVGTDGTEYTAGSVNVASATSITCNTTITMTQANSPYDVKVTGPNNISGTLADGLILDNAPVFATAANTNLGTVNPGDTDFSGLTTAAATDPDGDSITHTISAGALPTGMTLNTNGTFAGTVADPLADQDFTFTVQAATTDSTSTRQFVITNTNAEYVAATGGTVTTVDTDYKVHTFTGDGCFVVTSTGNPAGSTTVDYLVVAGGGGGQNPAGGAGGGAGGFRTSFTGGTTDAGPVAGTAITVSATTYPITVGGGGAVGGGGSPSTFSTITSSGGGGAPGGTGGSGAGGSPGIGNTPNVSPPQGFPGGQPGSTNRAPSFGGHGGGAKQRGDDGGANWGDISNINSYSGSGGRGFYSTITGSQVGYAGGGTGGSPAICFIIGITNYPYPASPDYGPSGQPTAGPGTAYGGGLGGWELPKANTGGGGQGNTGRCGRNYNGPPGIPGPYPAQGGGKGVVILRYKFQ